MNGIVPCEWGTLRSGRWLFSINFSKSIFGFYRIVIVPNAYLVSVARYSIGYRSEYHSLSAIGKLC